MQYCIPFFIKSKYSKDVNELSIRVTDESDIKLLPNFIQDHPNQRIIIKIMSEDFWEKNKLASIKERLLKLNNYAFCMSKDIDFYKKREFAAYFQNLPFFFEEGANTWDILRGMLSMGVSDIYVTEELGFELNKVSEVVHSFDVKIRCYPNIAQSSWSGYDPKYCFWIRPEDVSIYSEYVDVLEFWTNKSFDATKVDTLYEIYSKDQKWLGDLSTLIIGLSSSEYHIDSRRLIELWGLNRVKCKKKCAKGEKCHICPYCLALAKTLEENNLVLTKDKTAH